MVVRSGWVHIWSQLSIPSYDCILAVRGARSLIVSTGSPDQKRVMRGFLLAIDSPISSTRAQAGIALLRDVTGYITF
jgi:hypothetical protein